MTGACAMCGDAWMAEADSAGQATQRGSRQAAQPAAADLPQADDVIRGHASGLVQDRLGEAVIRGHIHHDCAQRAAGRVAAAQSGRAAESRQALTGGKSHARARTQATPAVRLARCAACGLSRRVEAGKKLLKSDEL